MRKLFWTIKLAYMVGSCANFVAKKCQQFDSTTSRGIVCFLFYRMVLSKFAFGINGGAT